MKRTLFAVIGTILAAACGGTMSAPSLGTSSDALFGDVPNWQRLLTCDGGAAVLDVNTNERRNLQFVIRDANIISFLNSVGAVHSAFGAKEIIESGWTGSLEWRAGLGPIIHGQPYGAPGVFNTGDFKEMITEYDTYQGWFGPFVRIAREGAGIKLQYGSIEKRGCKKLTTYCPGDGYPCQDSCEIDYSAYVEKANWVFQNCN